MRFLLSRYLAQFIVVYDEGSLRAAAEKVAITQPALSKSMKQLEDLMEMKLFERSTGKLIPTAYADILRKRANIILKEAETTERELRLVQESYFKPIQASAGPVWLSIMLPNILPGFYECYPTVKLGIRLEASDIAIPKIYDGSIDMYFGLIPEEMPFEGLASIPIKTLNTIFYARHDHPIHQEDINSQLAASTTYPWSGFGIVKDPTNTPVAQKLRSQGIDYKGVDYGIESLTGLASVASKTDLIVLSVDMVESAFLSHDLKKIEGIKINHSFTSGVVCRKSLLQFKPITALIEALKEAYSD